MARRDSNEGRTVVSAQAARGAVMRSRVVWVLTASMLLAGVVCIALLAYFWEDWGWRT